MLVMLPRPARHQLVDLAAPFHAGRGRAVALIADQVLPAYDLQEPRPMLWVGRARVDVNVVVGATALAGVDADRRGAPPPRLRPPPPRRPAACAPPVGEGGAGGVEDPGPPFELPKLTPARAP